MRSLVISHIDVFGEDPNGSIHAIKTLIYRLAEKSETTVYYCTRTEATPDPNGKIKVVSGNKKKLSKLQILLRTRLDNFLVRNFRLVFNSVFETLISFKKKRDGLEEFRNTHKINEFRRFLEDSESFDFIIVEYIHNAYLLDAFEDDNSITAIDMHDIMYRRAESFLSFGVAPALAISKKQELAILGRFDIVLAIQSNEARILRDQLDVTVLSVPRPQEVRTHLNDTLFKRSSDRLHCLFFASKAIFNGHALLWFIDNVWNDELELQYELVVAGSICDVLPKRVEKKARLIGRVASSDDAYSLADIVINPIKMGSGLKIKNLEAMAFGKPVITTSLGAEGITQEGGRGIWIADDSLCFRKLLMDLSDCPDEIERMGRLARDFVRECFNPTVCFSEFDAMMANVVEGRDR